MLLELTSSNHEGLGHLSENAITFQVLVVVPAPMAKARVTGEGEFAVSMYTKAKLGKWAQIS